MRTSFVDSRGRPTAYAYACGAVETHHASEDRHFRIVYRHGLYMVQGIGIGQAQAFTRLQDARTRFAALKRGK